MRRADGLMALLYSAFLMYLIFSGQYTLLMNPKFMLLTFASACVLAVYGIFSLVRPPAMVSYVRLAVFAVFLIAALSIHYRELGMADMLFKPF